MLIILNSCSSSEKERSYTQVEFNHILDSMKQVKLKEIKKEGVIDLKMRSSIELKPRVDSIIQTRDSLRKNK